MRGLMHLKVVTARTILASIVVVALAGAAMEELSSYAVSDAKAASLTGGQTGCNSSTIGNGTFGCLTGTCPTQNLRGCGMGNHCVQNGMPCNDCAGTYTGEICAGN